MKLIFAIVQDQDAGNVIDALTENNFRVTKLSTSGGFLMMGVEEKDMDELFDILEENCSVREEATSMVSMPYPLNVRVGGATIFILDVSEYNRY